MMLHEASRRLAEHFKYTLPTEDGLVCVCVGGGGLKQMTAETGSTLNRIIGRFWHPEKHFFFLIEEVKN